MISIIAAIGKNRELGLNNKLLWNIPEDMKRFRELTQGHAVIMGRKTFESIGRPLPNRTNIVVSRSCHPERMKRVEAIVPLRGRSLSNTGESDSSTIARNDNQGIIVCTFLEQAIEEGKSSFAKASEDKEIFVIGGGQIYEAAIKLADKLYLTIVEGSYEADTYFPDYSEFKKIISQTTGESSGYKYTFLELER